MPRIPAERANALVMGGTEERSAQAVTKQHPFGGRTDAAVVAGTSAG